MATAVSGYAVQSWEKILAADYSDRQLGKDTYSVNFSDTQVIGEGQLRDLMALHCSELALANGYGYFRVVDGHDATGTAVLTVRGYPRFMVSLHFPTRAATIQFRSAKEGPQDIDATEATKLLREEYDLARLN
jgi:hypothetical protein